MEASTCIMLLPDAEYKSARPTVTDHHLTVAYFGKEVSDEGVTRLRRAIDVIARQTQPITARANGLGVFNAGDDGYALVDLIDGIGTFKVRGLVENLFGANTPAKIDYTHGFTPHMTRAFIAAEDRDNIGLNGDDIDNLEFTFEAIGVWVGEEHYEVAL